jgi:hypothetical protein
MLGLLMIVYLIVLGLNIWFLPKVSAILEMGDIRAAVGTKHSVAALLLGLIPGLNIFTIFVGGILLTKTMTLLSATHSLAEVEIDQFNKMLKKLGSNE